MLDVRENEIALCKLSGGTAKLPCLKGTLDQRTVVPRLTTKHYAKNTGNFRFFV